MADSLTGRVCPNCGSPDIAMIDGAIRCASCNSTLRWSASGTELVVVATLKRCPLCGEPSEPGVAYCRTCGATVAEACPRCGERNPLESGYCGTCRYPLSRTPEECPRCGHVQPTGESLCERCDLPLSEAPRLEVAGSDRLTIGPLQTSFELAAPGEAGQSRAVLTGVRRWLGLVRVPTEASVVVRNAGGRMLRVQVEVPRGFAAPDTLSLAAGEETRLTVRPKISEAVRWRRRKGMVWALGGRYQGVVRLSSDGGSCALPISMRVKHGEPIQETDQSTLWAWWWRTVERPSSRRASRLLRAAKVVLVLLIVSFVIVWASVLLPQMLR